MNYNRWKTVSGKDWQSIENIIVECDKNKNIEFFKISIVLVFRIKVGFVFFPFSLIFILDFPVLVLKIQVFSQENTSQNLCTKINHSIFQLTSFRGQQNSHIFFLRSWLSDAKITYDWRRKNSTAWNGKWLQHKSRYNYP